MHSDKPCSIGALRDCLKTLTPSKDAPRLSSVRQLPPARFAAIARR